ncbi:MarR family winged helix-turn-helix transcriptional regulator [Muricoccus aerilatus]|uniref:MarR family winged helix-turn-helix transcriptional regulator n=1 Tax=Muricoccus aerilatus TaxID=452982 RepID=UPI0005C1FA48|nr:MarR family transcriptional regulator [Roseomonas aerilata]
MADQRETRFRRPAAGTPQAGTAEVVDFDRYLPVVLSKLVAELRQSANAFFRQRYSITLLEWRILSFLAAEGSASAYAIGTEAELDKAAVSRSLRALEQRALVLIDRMPGDARGRLAVTLTSEGRALHDTIFDEIMERHARLVDGLSAPAIETLLGSLAQLRRNIPSMGRKGGKVEEALRPAKQRR